MELIVLFIAAIIWLVIKSLSQPPRPEDLPEYQGQGRWSRGQDPQQQPEEDLPENALQGQTYFADRIEEPMEVVELDSPAALPEIASDLLQRETVIKGVIYSELLGPPRAKKPHRIYGGR